MKSILYLVFLVLFIPFTFPQEEANTCVDNTGYWACQSWRAAGICDNDGYYNHMYENCRRTCNLCKENDNGNGNEIRTSGHRPCIDHRTNCVLWRKHCFRNSSHYDFMTKHCRRSCLLCNDDTCIDKRKKCNQYKTLGYCHSEHKYFRFMNKTCSAACNFCSPKPKAKNVISKNVTLKQYFACDFEEHTCEWENHHFGDDADWKVGTSTMGPKFGYNNSASYLFIDSIFTGYHAKLWLPWQLVLPIGVEHSGMCFHFRYLLSGGDLSVVQSSTQTIERKFPKEIVLFKSKAETNIWSEEMLVEVEVSSTSVLWIVATKGPYDSLVAIDSLYFTKGACFA